MLTCESRRPQHRVQLDGIESECIALRAETAQRVYRSRVLGACTGCPQSLVEMADGEGLIVGPRLVDEARAAITRATGSTK